MGKGDKELLINDLCARLPYGLKCAYFNTKNEFKVGELLAVLCKEKRVLIDKLSIDYDGCDCIGVIPYLFPLSSLTSKQRTEIGKILTDVKEQYSPYGVVNTEGCDNLFICSVKQSNALINYCLSQHLDINGLIEKGLAIDATNLEIY